MKLVDHKVSMLQLDPRNYRTGPAQSQPDAIAKIVEIQGEKIVEMAADIMEFGLSPFDLTAVSLANGEGFRVVYEGNRRVAALKLLENPALAGNAVIQAKIERLRPQYLKAPIRELQCSEISDRETAMRWVDRKQGTGLGGKGTETWGFVANSRRRADGGDVDRWLATLNFLRHSGDTMDGVELAFSQYRIGATIERVLRGPAMFDTLGVRYFPDGRIEFQNGDSKGGRALLRALMSDLVDLRPDTSAFYTNDQIAAFLAAYENAATKKAETKGEPAGIEPTARGNAENAGTEGRDAGSAAVRKAYTAKTKKDDQVKAQSAEAKKGAETSGRVRSPQSQRKTLAPTAAKAKLEIKNERIHELYVSLRKLEVARRTFVASVMIRIFLDLTLTHYLIETAHPLPKELADKGVKNWLNKSATLKDKLSAGLSVADPTGASQVFRNARDGLNKLHSHLVYALHDYVHQIEMHPPTTESVIFAWDSYHPLFQKLYDLLKSK